MKWNWDPGQWKRWTKVLLALATAWPIIYMGLFFIGIFSFVLIASFTAQRSNRNTEDIDLIQLEQKINNGELSQLTIRPTEIVACDRTCACEYHTSVSNRATRAEIIRQAREPDQNGVPRVAKIDEETARPAVSPALPIGVAVLFGAHMVTILLIMGLLPIYVILAVKSDRLDQTTRIIWIVLICMMGMLAMPVYWYFYIWRDAPPASSVPSSP